MSEKCIERCPHCEEYIKKYGEAYHNVYPEYKGYKYEGLPHCQGCGSILVNGEWVFECKTCEKRVEKLHGLFVPHLCKECYDALIAKDIRTGNICTQCREPRSQCCC